MDVARTPEGTGRWRSPRGIEKCELNDADPPARLAHVLAKPRAAMELDAAGNRGSGLSHSGVVHPKIRAAPAG